MKRSRIDKDGKNDFLYYQSVIYQPLISYRFDSETIFTNKQNLNPELLKFVFRKERYNALLFTV